jgi:hypothetical protein
MWNPFMASKKPRWQIADMGARAEHLQLLEAKAVGNRLYKIRYVLGYGEHGQQSLFAKKYGFEEGSWSHWEIGRVVIPPHAAGQLIFAVDGLTADYIYFGRLGGVPFDMRAELLKAPDRDRRKPSSSKKKKRAAYKE